MDGTPGNKGHFRKDLAQRLLDATQEVRQFGADKVFRRSELERKDSGWGQLGRHFPEELVGIESVELRSLRIGKVEDDDVEPVSRRLQKQAPVDGVRVHSWIGTDRTPFLRKVAPGQIQNRRIKLNVVDALDGRVLESLGEASVHAAADQQQASRRGMLQQGEMDSFLRRLEVRYAEDYQTIFEETASAFCLNHGQIAIDGVADRHHLEATPEPGQ